MRRKTVPEGIRVTKVGFWYVVLAVVVGVAATNTGNNALYLVEALLLALLVISGVTSRQNLRRLELELTPPPEVYARQPFSLRYRLANRGRLMARRLLVISGAGEGKPVLVPLLRRGAERRGAIELVVARRGPVRIDYLHLSSIFPFGFFRKGLRYRVGCEFLALPEILPRSQRVAGGVGPAGEVGARRAGWGSELLTLRDFRHGDDRRGIHWKQSARTGDLVYMEKEAERGRRLSIQLDNGAAPLLADDLAERFELLVSEAATAAHHYLGRDWEVELVTRDARIPFGRGRRHRLRILEALALLEIAAPGAGPLTAGDPQATALCLGLGAEPRVLAS